MDSLKLSAGSYELNRFLAGGFETDILTTIYGPGGSGKTNIAMIVATSQAKKGNKVIFMDTEGGFSSERFSQIHAGDTVSCQKALQNILLLRPTSYTEQEKEFSRLLKFVKRETISLIIIDSIAMLYRLELGSAITNNDSEEIARINRTLAGQLRTLNEISRKQHIPIILTNQVYSLFQQETESSIEKTFSMVGGDLLKYWSKCLIEVSRHHGRRTLRLVKHRSLREKTMHFEIVQRGIQKKGIF